jgi:hypothetical protein
VNLQGRILLGSSIYTASTWRVAAMSGHIYGGPMYIQRYPDMHKMPPICTNHYERSPSGKVYGYFICPLETENSTYIYCCGAEKREYCCNKEMAQEYYETHSKKPGLSVEGIIGIVCVFLFIICLGIFCCIKRKRAGVIIRRFSKKGTNRHAENGTQAVPLTGPIPTYPVQPGIPPQVAPGLPPPSYDAIVAPKPGYEGSNDLPYGPPQPPSYDEKSGPPPPGMNTPPPSYWTPYPPANRDPNNPTSNEAPYPPAGGMPYPPQSAPYQFSSDTPYPPPNSAPYPPGDGAPYPPGDGAPYPPGDGAPYPPVGGAPYPSVGGAPYPSAGGAPYSPVGGAPYPPYPQQGDTIEPSSIASAPQSSEFPTSDGATTYNPNLSSKHHR